MKVLVNGINGQLGNDVLKELHKRGIPSLGAGKADLDITDFQATQKFINDYQPDAVIHCAAYTAVDRAEEDRELCELVNVEGAKNIAIVCRSLDAKMVYISTDYIFSGSGEEAHEVDDLSGPLSIYGRTKLAGEKIVNELVKKHFIVRASWVFGANGSSFIKTMLCIGLGQEEIGVVCDQVGSPTYTVDLASLICDMITTESYGTYHATNEGYCSWAELAQQIFRLVGYSTKVNPIQTSEYITKAQRPLNSRLSKASLDQAGFSRLPDWRDALRRYLIEIDAMRVQFP